MESCQAVEKEIDRVISKFEILQDHNTRCLNELITQIENIVAEIGAGEEREVSATQSVVVSRCAHKISDVINQVSGDHKDLHSMVSKVGKVIDRNFINEFTGVIIHNAFEEDGRQKLINHVISEHLLREGMLGVLDSFSQETKMEISEEEKRPYLDLHDILQSLRKHDLDAAFCWAEKNDAKQLLFKLHRLKFISLLKEGRTKQSELIAYSRIFSNFAPVHSKEISTLMGSLIYLQQGVANSPYRHLLDDTNWEEIYEYFTRDVCTLMGLPVDSKLSVTTRAGCIAMPPLLNIQQVMQERHCSNVWSAKDELPIEIDLGKDYQFHSIFACPILRQQCTETNPPMKLICGHVISKDALNKLSTGHKVKCPYCPQEQDPADAIRVYF